MKLLHKFLSYLFYLIFNLISYHSFDKFFKSLNINHVFHLNILSIRSSCTLLCKTPLSASTSDWFNLNIFRTVNLHPYDSIIFSLFTSSRIFGSFQVKRMKSHSIICLHQIGFWGFSSRKNWIHQFYLHCNLVLRENFLFEHSGRFSGKNNL